MHPEHTTRQRLDLLLEQIPRRFRVPAVPQLAESPTYADVIADAIEAARVSINEGVAAVDEHGRRFVHAMTHLIKDALGQPGDPVFQAKMLELQSPTVQEYIELLAQAEQDKRTIRAAINSHAHPEKLLRSGTPRLAVVMADVHDIVASSSWDHLPKALERAMSSRDVRAAPEVLKSLSGLPENPALQRLQRAQTLEADPRVQQWQRLRDQAGPRSGSQDAMLQGSTAKQRGRRVENLAAQALQLMAHQLDEAAESPVTHRVVTSLRVPAALLSGVNRAKAEWDAVLLRKASPTSWDISLLVEAKSSADSIATDLPRLKRGIDLLAGADPSISYTFETQQGTVAIRGATLSALPRDQTDLKHLVLYCCEGPAEARPRLLSAAGRMQLLFADESLRYAQAIEQEQPGDTRLLYGLWRQVLHADEWKAVRNQYATLHQACELAVHPDDFLAAMG